MLPVYQNRFGEHENCKGAKYSVSAFMQFLFGALQLYLGSGLTYVSNNFTINYKTFIHECMFIKDTVTIL